MTTPLDFSSTVQITVIREQGRIVDIVTTCPEVTHFLNMLKMSRSYHTWVNYAYDLKAFFGVIPKLPKSVYWRDCVRFIQSQQQAGLSDATINRRLAALSSLFDEWTCSLQIRCAPTLSNLTRASTTLGFAVRGFTGGNPKRLLTFWEKRICGLSSGLCQLGETDQ